MKQRTLSIRNIGRQLLMLLSAVWVITACTVLDDDLSMNSDEGLNFYSAAAPNTWEGKWTVNRQVIDTAKITIDSMIRIRYPEEYLISLYHGPIGKEVRGKGSTSKILLQQQGFSDNTVFMTYKAFPALLETHSQPYYCNGTFTVTTGQKDYYIELLSTENANIIYAADKGQWTLGIPVSHFRVTDLETGQLSVHELPAGLTLYYNTEKRIR